ncbi:hypothetical protein ASPBRDRAFT_51562 [Aspergillus brasiliensis CBS 101740]|uniref:Uncharacterized protein n=1 Tax=Aspergillus brasiliensis (strain CBS 101740 / IMI 381727 / IBT 21946) TaxID=767769 RepID=A0A1L9UWA0_ASPBC|nr:hypothetical protein ASPBRDRAFT_51562 [Aspergillus brasiliensis CBS 101740]
MKSYRSHVNNQIEQNPSTLGPLRDFLNDPQSDQQVSRLGVLEFTQLNSPPVYRQLDHQCLLHDLISEDISITEPCSLYGRIILVENISRGVMEILGSVLDIDPIFFESHIGHYDCSKDPMFEAEGDSAQKFLTCHPRAVTLEGVQGYSESKKYLTATALVLVDPPVLNGLRLIPDRGPVCPITTSGRRLFRGGYEDITGTDLPNEESGPPGPPNEGDCSSCPPRDGLFDDLIYYWKNRLAPSFNFTKPPMKSLAYYPIQSALAEWTNSHIAMVLFLQHYDSALIKRAFREKSVKVKKNLDNSARPPKQPESSVSTLTALRRWFISPVRNPPPQTQKKTTLSRESSEEKTLRLIRSDPMFQNFMTLRTWVMPIITQNNQDSEYLRLRIVAPPLILDSYDTVINNLTQFASALETILPWGKEFADALTNTIIEFQREHKYIYPEDLV